MNESHRLTAFEMMAWTDRAACRDGGLSMHPHPSDKDGVRAAKARCTICPVVSECLAYALDTGEGWGVWGGMDTEERRRLKRNENRRARAESSRNPAEQA